MTKPVKLKKGDRVLVKGDGRHYDYQDSYYGTICIVVREKEGRVYVVKEGSKSKTYTASAPRNWFRKVS